MASHVVKRIPLIRFPVRMKTPAAPPAAGSPSSALGAESKIPSTTGVDAAGSSRPIHSNVPAQKAPASGGA
ncbi:hypothetical protein M758_4G133300 [Ceratodon purpureus]|nr:hypothetical protein M758_4G133300 [Ceratodon purpureus]